MQLTPETILVPMMSGEAKPFDVLSFDCAGHRLSVRQINSGLCYILHRATGLKISGEYTGDRKEAAEGFADCVKIGVYDLSQLAKNAATFPTINAPSQYREEPTPAGIQLCIPGTERRPVENGKPAQLSLWG